ncbi:MAG: NAD-glutamate dehydrogenase [Proteobacteria bacterium]|nr:NAD-glutamate dehydrogenase [Pseudomonadota bacterium]
MDGLSLVSVLEGGKLARRDLFWHYPHYGNQGGSPGSAVRLGDWKLIERFEDELEIEAAVERLKDGMTVVYTRTGAAMSTAARERHQKAAASYVAMGAPGKLADRMSALLLTRAALDIVDLAAAHKRDVLESARLYSAFNQKIGFYWLHVSAEDLKVHGRWQAIARSNLRDDFYRIRRDLAAQILSKRSKQDISVAVDNWLHERSAKVERFKSMVEEMSARNDVDFATLTVAAQEMRDLIAN